MYTINTTFCTDPGLETEVIAWLQNVYIPKALEAGLSHPRLSRVMVTQPGDALALALQFRADSPSRVHQWHKTLEPDLMAEATRIWGERLLPFVTHLKTLYEPGNGTDQGV